MRRIGTVVLMAIVAGCGVAFAAQPASKATASVGKIVVLESTDMQERTIMTNDIKTSTGADLFVDVSLECGLYTSAKVDSMAGIEDRAEAMAGVEISVLVDGVEAKPGPVTFCRRSQILKAEFQGLLTDEDGNVCLSEDPLSPGTMLLDEDCLRPETLEMALDTMGSHSFNFIYPNLRSGNHTVEVRAKVDSYTESTLYSGAKVRDGDIFGDSDDDFAADDTVLSVDRGGKFQVGQVIVIEDEHLLVNGIQNEGVDDPSGKDLLVQRGWNDTTAVPHTRRTPIYIVAGADASASIGNGSVTVEMVKMIRNEEIELTE